MEQLVSIAIFVGFGLFFVLLNLTLGRFLRPSLPGAQKKAVYECGEVAVGPSWVQFDLRFYIVALFYLVFDVEVALIYPWAVAYRQYALYAMVVGLPFILLVVIGYAYEWWSGSLDWVRSSVNTSVRTSANSATMAKLARTDPQSFDPTSPPTDL